MTKDERKSFIILKDKNVYRGLLALSLPLMFSNLLRSLHDIVDMYFVSDLGTGSVSSISITWSMLFIFLGFGFGLAAAGTALISQFLGAKEEQKAKRTTGQLLFISIILGVISNLLIYFLSPQVLTLMGAQGYVYENAIEYVRIRSFEMIPFFIFMVYSSNRNASGDTVSPVILSSIMIVLNIILSPVLIRGFNMGVAGAAYATVISTSVLLPVTLYFLRFSKSGVTVSVKDLMPRFTIIRKIMKIAIPMSLSQAITSIGFAIMSSMIMRQFGEVTFDAFGVGNRINSLTLLPIISVGSVLSTFIGQNVGALQPERAKLVFRRAVVITLAIALLGVALVLPLRRPIVGLFIENPDSLELAVTYMFYLTLTLPFFGVFQLLIGVFNGLGMAKYTLITSLSRLWAFRIPMILVFVYWFNMDQSSVWHAMWISNIFAVMLGLFLYRRCTFEPIIMDTVGMDE